MRELLMFWLREIDRKPIVLVPLLALVLTIHMNFVTGWKTGNESVGMGLIFLGMAIATAYCGTVGLSGKAKGWKKPALIAGLLVGFVLDQVCGWQSLGIRFADGQVARTTKATAGASLAERIEDKRAERRKIGTVRAIGAIEAEATLECEKKSRIYPDGIGPACTKLRGELASTKRVAELEAEIAALLAQAEGREQVAGGAPQWQVPIYLASGAMQALYGNRAKPVTAEQIVFVFMILVSAAIGILANFGFWMFGCGHEAGEDADDGEREAWGDTGGLAARPGVPIDIGRPLQIGGPERRVQLADTRGSEARGGEPGGWPGGGGGRGEASAPVTIHIGTGAGGVAPHASVPSAGNGGTGKAEARRQAGDRHDLAALPADAPPIDRSRVRRVLGALEREAADVMLAFRAACVVDTPGAITSTEDLYARYYQWAGARRAIGEGPFWDLWPEVTGLEVASIGTHGHVHGVALRLAPALEAIEGARHVAA